MIRSIIRSEEFELNIKWRLTNCCNYNCSYCIRKNKLDDIKNIKYDQQLLEETLPEIVRLILENNKTTRIELMGGEVSILNLETILLKLFNSTNNLIKRINITSNFSRDISYYNNLIKICSEYNVQFYATFSWHREYSTLEKFINKFNQLENNELTHFEIETVSQSNNIEEIKEFINVCNKNNIDYLVDADVKDKNCNELITTTNKRNKIGYKIIKDDGSIETCNSMRELIKNYGDYAKNIIYLKDYYCTLDYNYVYIDKNLHIGYNKWANKCKIPEHISCFHLLKEPIVCPKGCSLCGHMSVSQIKEDLLNLGEDKCKIF